MVGGAVVSRLFLWLALLSPTLSPLLLKQSDDLTLTLLDSHLVTGRSFYMCARPLGPSGNKETGTEFRCKTFIWSSDWSGRQ